MRVSWVSYLDPDHFDGGGELSMREYIRTGRRRGHVIDVHGYLKGRPQRALRRSGLHRGFRPTFEGADLVVLSNLGNAPSFPARIPQEVVDDALATGRAVVHQEAWVDVCPLDVPCLGHVEACPAACDKRPAHALFSRAYAAMYNSPLQRRTIASVLGGDVPSRSVMCRPYLDVDRFVDLGGPRDIDVLYVGRINEAKGYSALIERFGADRMTFAGRNELGHAVAGRYLGEVAYDDLPALYNRARTFAHLPQWLEPMGRAPVEAALCGCEVVLNDRVGVASYPRETWTDRGQVARANDLLWDELEALLEPAAADRS